MRWLKSYVLSLEQISGAQAKVTIYSKCGKETTIPEHHADTVVSLANAGRNDHTFAYHIWKNYDTLEDITFFVKDTLNPTDPQVIHTPLQKGFPVHTPLTCPRYPLVAEAGF